MDSLKKKARIAGLLYLGIVLTGPFVLIYVPGKLFVSGDASATAANILAHQSLFRAHIAVGFVAELLFIATVLALYHLLKHVSRPLATGMALLVLVSAPLAFLGLANEVATLALLRGGELLAAFDAPQRDALAMLLFEADTHGALVSEMFWGLWLLPLAVLVYRSGFLPRLLGVWLFVNGLAYMVTSSTGLLAPDRYSQVSTFALPILLGEVAFVLWLVIVGARERPSPAAAP